MVMTTTFTDRIGKDKTTQHYEFPTKKIDDADRFATTVKSH